MESQGNVGLITCWAILEFWILLIGRQNIGIERIGRQLWGRSRFTPVKYRAEHGDETRTSIYAYASQYNFTKGINLLYQFSRIYYFFAWFYQIIPSRYNNEVPYSEISSHSLLYPPWIWKFVVRTCS